MSGGGVLQVQVLIPNSIYFYNQLMGGGVVQVQVPIRGGISHFPPKFEYIFVDVITFFPILLCRYFYYQLVACALR